MDDVTDSTGHAVSSPRVKALVWEMGSTNGDVTYFVDTVVGRYAAWEAYGRGRVIVPGAISFREEGSTAEDAKAAAQADFEARILSVLEP